MYLPDGCAYAVTLRWWDGQEREKTVVFGTAQTALDCAKAYMAKDTANNYGEWQKRGDADLHGSFRWIEINSTRHEVSVYPLAIHGKTGTNLLRKGW